MMVFLVIKLSISSPCIVKTTNLQTNVIMNFSSDYLRNTLYNCSVLSLFYVIVIIIVIYYVKLCKISDEQK